MEEWKIRLKQAREAKSLNKTAFAKLVGVSNPTVTDWEKSVEDGGIAEITGPNLVRVCEVLSITEKWLLDGVEYQRGSQLPMHAAQGVAEYELGSSQFQQVPVIGKGMGGIPDDRTWTDGDFPAGTSNEYAILATSDPNAFLARVEESSMAPRYNPGEYFLVEPNTDPQIGDDVLVRFKNDGTSLKRLVSRQGGFIGLSSYNNTTIITAKEEEVAWIYYVAHPVPVRKIKNRI